MKINGFTFIYFLVVLFLFTSCAKEAAPTGGPKDTTPPEVLSEFPNNYTTQFNEKKIKVHFNEYIQLKNIQQELLISPPLKEKPKIVLKGKKMVITFKDSLPQNRTVNMNFNNAIVDLNESNPYQNYQYVFSTGDIVDTSFIDGRVIDAQTGKPVEKALVMLYESFNDSVVKQKIPSYITRTNRQGIFVLNNLNSGPYKIFALKDKNRNMFYDQPQESVAFFKEKINPLVEWTKIIDTIELAKIEPTGDTIYKDSIVEKQVQVSSLKPFQLKMFTIDYVKYYLNSKNRINRSLISFGFSRNIESFGTEINILQPKINNTQPYIKQMITPDSVLYYLTDSILYKSDTIYISISYPYTDSVNSVVTRTDSIFLIYNQKKLNIADTLLIYTTNLKSSKLNIDSALNFNWSEPLKKVNKNKIHMQIKRDTVYEPFDYDFNLNDLKLKSKITFKQDLLANYRLIFDSASIVSSTGKVIDSTVINFSYFEESNYGNLILTIDSLCPNSIFQLVDKKDKVISQLKYPNSKTLEFPQLTPNTYNLRLLIDDNHNGKWDTGEYYQKKQPETTIAMPNNIIIKANWDTEQVWELSSELKLLD